MCVCVCVCVRGRVIPELFWILLPCTGIASLPSVDYARVAMSGLSDSPCARK